MPLASLAVALLFTVFPLIFRASSATNCWRRPPRRWWLSRSATGTRAWDHGSSLSVIVALTPVRLVAVITSLLATAIFAQLRAALAWSAGIGAFILAILISLTLAAAWLAIGSPRLLPRAAAR
jgi:hypothetical protein